MKIHVACIEGKRKVYVVSTCNGEDRRKEAADIVCGNRK
jgi:hypothetical protein